MILYYVVLIYYNQEEWYNNLRSEDTASDIRKVEDKSTETFDVFKEKLSKADDYLCTFTKDYFEIEWSESEAEYVVDKTAEHTEVLWIEEEGNQIYGESERLRSEGADVTTEYINGLNNSVYESITTTPWTTSQTVYSYDDYGNTEDVVQGYGYNGERRDQSGLIYLRARYYNPKIGRFIQIDSYRGEKEQPDTQNRYIYTLNNPYKYIDPSGNEPLDSNDFYKPNQNKKKLNRPSLLDRLAKNNWHPMQDIVELAGSTEKGYEGLSPDNVFNTNYKPIVKPCPPKPKNDAPAPPRELIGVYSRSYTKTYSPDVIYLNILGISVRTRLYTKKLLDNASSVSLDKGALLNIVNENVTSLPDDELSVGGVIDIFQSLGISASISFSSLDINAFISLGGVSLSLGLTFSLNFLIGRHGLVISYEEQVNDEVSIGMELEASATGYSIISVALAFWGIPYLLGSLALLPA